MPSKALVMAVVSFLLVVLIFSLYSTPVVFARIKAGPIHCFNLGTADPGKVGCCQTFTYSNGTKKEYCTICDDTIPPSNCTPRFQVRETPTSSPPTSVLPPSGNNSGTPGTSIFNPVRNATNAVPSSNGTSTLPPGSIFKVPPGTVGSATNQSNNNGTASIGSINKTPVNHTNALPTGNNTGTPPPALKLSQPSLAGQQQQTTGHHHKGGNTGASTSSGSNSTSH